MTRTETHQALTRRGSLVTNIGLVAALVAVVAVVILAGSAWPPPSLADPMSVTGVQ